MSGYCCNLTCKSDSPVRSIQYHANYWRTEIYCNENPTEQPRASSDHLSDSRAGVASVKGAQSTFQCVPEHLRYVFSLRAVRMKSYSGPLRYL